MVASFLGGGLSNPFAESPMRLLSTAAMAGDPTPPVEAPGDPAITGAIPAQTPAATTPAGGGGFGLGDIGARVGDALSGKGLFGTSAPDDNEIDPMTGAPKGLARQQNMRSLMQLGLTFLVAGSRMSNDSRAAILAKAPGLVGGGDDALNSFAKSRLEMAKLRLEQQKLAQDQQASAAITKALGGGGDAAAAPSAGAQAVAQGQTALAQAAPAIATGDPSQATQGAPAAVPTPAMPTGNALAPGGVPRMAPQQQATGSGDDPSNWTHGEKLAVLVQPTTGAKAQMFGQIQANRAAGTRMGPVQYDQTTGEQYANTMDGRGNVTGRTNLGKPQIVSRDSGDGKYREKGFVDPITKQFTVTDRQDIRDPDEEKQSAASLSIAKGDRDTLATDYHDNVQKSLQTYDRMAKVRDDVSQGKGIFGTGVDLRRQAYNALVTMGYNFDGKLSESLNTTANFERVLKEGVAGVIKNFNGSTQVSDSDRKFAQEVMQASASGNRESVLNALNNGMQDIREQVSRYDANAKRHNSSLDEFGKAKGRLTVPTVDRDFEAGERDFQQRRQQQQAPAAAAQPQPDGGGVVRYERRDGKIVRVQ